MICIQNAAIDQNCSPFAPDLSDRWNWLRLNDDHRHRCLTNNSLGDTAESELRNAVAAVTSDYDCVHVVFLCVRDDKPKRVTKVVNRLDCHVKFFCALVYPLEEFFGLSFFNFFPLTKAPTRNETVLAR